ncbi:MAG: redoxin domain-containing protein [Armatimonadetes bacterium]|nr:redoxin domain-containing protein [Armatimonadota bacterium]
MNLRPLLSLAAVTLLWGCSQTPSGSSGTAAGKPAGSKSDEAAVALLKKSMDAYAAFDTFQASYDRVPTKPGTGAPTRTITYQKPNLFRIEAKTEKGDMTITSVSNGKEAIEYAVMGSDGSGMKQPAPTTLADAQLIQIRNPLVCGSLVYNFFKGSAGYADLVDESKAPTLLGKKEKSPTGEDAQVVKFYAKEHFGNVEALIGTQSGLVYRVSYDGAQFKEMAKSAKADESQIPDISAVETFKDIKTGAAFVASTFDTTPPKNVKLVDPSKPPASPLPIGKPAPNFKLTGMDGKTVNLSDLKGKVVLIDFWATWCGPCREGLPVTDKLHKEFASKGLQVLAVSDEEKPTVDKFVKDNGYSFPVFLDTDRSANTTYKIEGIPTLVIIDKNGNLASYAMGLEPEAMVREKLKKVGIG